MKVTHSCLLCTLLVGAVACGGSTAQNLAPETAEAASAIAAAEVVTTKDTPQAALHLKLARDQLGQSKKLIEKDESERAQLMLERSKADAELALFLAREHEAQEGAARAQRQVEALSDR